MGAVFLRFLGPDDRRIIMFDSDAQPRRPSAASRTIREDFQMAVGFLFLVLHKESETFFKAFFLDYQE